MAYRVLLINPNTSEWVTDALVGQIRQVLPADTRVEIDAATATLGASYIASEVAYVLASHALLDAYATHYDNHDAIAVGCFGDPGTSALAQISQARVIGMAQAAMQEAANSGSFAIVTGGAAWAPMLRRLAYDLGFADALSHVIAVEQSAAEMARDRSRALTSLAHACHQASSQGASQIILGGAAFAGFGDELAARTGLNIIDSVSAFARNLHQAARRQAPAEPTRSPPASADTAQFTGLSDPLLKLLTR